MYPFNFCTLIVDFTSAIANGLSAKFTQRGNDGERY